MSLEKSTIRAFQKILPNFVFETSVGFSEEFAQQRYRKKMEVPDASHTDDLSSTCWNNWLSNDGKLPVIGMPLPEWYRARDLLHRELGQYRRGNIEFPKGSEFFPTLGANSIEARLAQSRWTCTRSGFGEFSKIAYEHKALRRAVRRRYDKWFNSKGFDITRRESEMIIFNRFRLNGQSGLGFRIFSWKLSQITTFVEGSRFSTVPKNNEKRRPINIEPFGNILSQRSVGNWLKSEIFRIFDLDLNVLADTHRIRIRNVNDIATIDLKDASDSISLELCRFLLPGRLMRILETTRSHMVLGPDGNYHVTKKVSSMGNGFTFELMTLILTSICKVLDPEATVFGDDIIINSEKSERLMKLLSSVGLKVNYEKSFTDGPFRESCGANFHIDEGYIESFDFLYPESIGDCVLIWNKCARLGKLYPSFKKLQNTLYRSLPAALHGGPSTEFMSCDTLELVGTDSWDQDSPAVFPLFFVTPKVKGKAVPSNVKGKLSELHYKPDDFRLICGYEFKSSLRSKTLKHLKTRSQWAKYEMYLHGGRKSKDVISGQGEWVRVWFVSSGLRNFRVSALMT